MTTSLIFGALWVIAATLTATLPMRLQFPPGLTLLLLAPPLLIWIALDTSPWITLACLAAFVSMFRRPLAYFARKGLARLRRKS